ncbi:MAG: glycosyl hydrolase 115 family protein, partial [Lachnospiraceae bacterium]|nr:glycosyl hydrolase 115 family protein [Lachnospiraceae bacterium]
MAKENLRFDRNTTILVDEADLEGVKEVAGWVREDLKKVFSEADPSSEGMRIIAGTYGISPLIKDLSERGIVTPEGLFDKEDKALREVYKILPLPGDENGIVITGSDKRGTMYGLLAVSEECGVTPLVNWSGAAPARKESVPVSDTFFRVSKEPSVKYRGIFINDEYPAFGTWAKERFGGANAKCYAAVFEFLVRLHATYMWPAMWRDNFSMDGPGLLSAELADKLGIVMSTSHHEPCMRTGEEYRLLRGPESKYGDAWDFLSNREGITRFWEDGL